MGSLPPIVVIDDEPDDIFVIKRLLLKAEIKNKVIAFEDPRAVVDYLDAEDKKPRSLFTPCAVFSDLNMPGMSGLDVLSFVRKCANLHALPLFIVTSCVIPKERANAERLGVTFFWEKYPPISVLKKAAAEYFSETWPTE